MNRMYSDMRDNFPLIFASQVTAYWEDYAAYENGYKPVKMRNTKSRNTVKKSAKKSSAARNMHKVESSLDFPVIFPEKSKTLILPMHWQEVGGVLACYIPTNIGVFMLEFCHKKLLWQASWENRKVSYAQNPFLALAKLLGQDWYEHKLSGQNVSLYDFYAQIVFDYGQKPNVRNRTRKITIPGEFRESIQAKPSAKPNHYRQWLGRTKIEAKEIHKIVG